MFRLPPRSTPTDPPCPYTTLFRASLSLGDSAVFRIGWAEWRDPTTSLRLHSGDVVVQAGPSRLAHHGIDRVLGGSSRLLDRTGWEGGGRINVTLRRVTRPPEETA